MSASRLNFFSTLEFHLEKRWINMTRYYYGTLRFRLFNNYHELFVEELADILRLPLYGPGAVPKGLIHKISGLLLLGGLITPPKVKKPLASRTRASSMPKKVWRILCLDGVIVRTWQLNGSCSSYTRWHIIRPSMLLPLHLITWGELVGKTQVVFLLGV